MPCDGALVAEEIVREKPDIVNVEVDLGQVEEGEVGGKEGHCACEETGRLALAMAVISTIIVAVICDKLAAAGA